MPDTVAALPSNRDDNLSSSRYETVPRRDRFDRSYLLQKFVGRSRNVLELGCSTGYISRLLKQYDCRVVGIEMDRDAAYSASSICDRVLVADLNTDEWMEQVKETFDVVLMGDVLEHLVHPDRVLTNVRSVLAPGGEIVVSLPNLVHWSQRLKTLLGQFSYQSTGLLDHTHLRFFTARTARHLIEKSGYSIVKFYPIIGGPFTGNLRPFWQLLARLRPNLFGFQLLFRAQPVTNRSHRQSLESLFRA